MLTIFGIVFVNCKQVVIGSHQKGRGGLLRLLKISKRSLRTIFDMIRVSYMHPRGLGRLLCQENECWHGDCLTSWNSTLPNLQLFFTYKLARYNPKRNNFFERLTQNGSRLNRHRNMVRSNTCMHISKAWQSWMIYNML